MKVPTKGKLTYLDKDRPRPGFGTWQPSTADITRHAGLSPDIHDNNIMFRQSDDLRRQNSFYSRPGRPSTHGSTEMDAHNSRYSHIHSTMGQHSPDLPNFDFEDDVFYDHVSLKPSNDMESSYLVTGRENLKQRSQGPIMPQGSAFLSVDGHSDGFPSRRTERYEVEQPSPNYKPTHQTSPGKSVIPPHLRSPDPSVLFVPPRTRSPLTTIPISSSMHTPSIGSGSHVQLSNDHLRQPHDQHRNTNPQSPHDPLASGSPRPSPGKDRMPRTSTPAGSDLFVQSYPYSKHSKQYDNVKPRFSHSDKKRKEKREDDSDDACERWSERSHRRRHPSYRRKRRDNSPDGSPSHSDGSDRNRKPKRKRRGNEERPTNRRGKKPYYNNDGGDDPSDPSDNSDYDYSSSDDDYETDSDMYRSSCRSRRRHRISKTIRLVGFSGKTPDLPKFSNSCHDTVTYEEFLEQFKRQAYGLCLPRCSWARVLATYFCDGALLVYNKVIKAHPRYADSYSKLTQALREKFSCNGGSGRAADLFLRTKRKTESVGRFFMSVLSLAGQAFPTLDEQALDEVIKSVFILGLDPHSKRQLLDWEPKTAQDAFEQAQRIETTEFIMQNEATPDLSHLSNHQAAVSAVTEEEILEQDRTCLNSYEENDMGYQGQDMRQFDILGNPVCDQYQYRQYQHRYTPSRYDNQASYQSRRNFRSRQYFQPRSNFKSGHRYQSRSNFAQQRPGANQSSNMTFNEPPVFGDRHSYIPEDSEALFRNHAGHIEYEYESNDFSTNNSIHCYSCFREGRHSCDCDPSVNTSAEGTTRNIAVEEVTNVCDVIPTMVKRTTPFNPPPKQNGHLVYQPQPLTSLKKTNQVDDETPPKAPESSQPDVKPPTTPQPTQKVSENLDNHYSKPSVDDSIVHISLARNEESIVPCCGPPARNEPRRGEIIDHFDNRLQLFVVNENKLTVDPGFHTPAEQGQVSLTPALSHQKHTYTSNTRLASRLEHNGRARALSDTVIGMGPGLKIEYPCLRGTSFSIILDSHAVDGDGTDAQQNVQMVQPETDPVSLPSTMTAQTHTEMKMVTAHADGEPVQGTHEGEDQQLHKLSLAQEGKHSPALMAGKVLSLAMERLVSCLPDTTTVHHLVIMISCLLQPATRSMLSSTYQTNVNFPWLQIDKKPRSLMRVQSIQKCPVYNNTVYTVSSLSFQTCYRRTLLEQEMGLRCYKRRRKKWVISSCNHQPHDKGNPCNVESIEQHLCKLHMRNLSNVQSIEHRQYQLNMRNLSNVESIERQHQLERMIQTCPHVLVLISYLSPRPVIDRKQALPLFQPEKVEYVSSGKLTSY